MGKEGLAETQNGRKGMEPQKNEDEALRQKEQLKKIREAQAKAYEAEKERINEQYNKEGIPIDDLMADYLKDDLYKEYLVHMAILTCDQATVQDFVLPNGRKISLSDRNPRRKQGELEVDENQNSVSSNGLCYATVWDTLKGYNIPHFQCNCKQSQISREEMINIMKDKDCCKFGVCRHLMKLEKWWSNMPMEGRSYLTQIDTYPTGDGPILESAEREAQGITMTSVLFCKQGGIIYPVTSGQSILDELVTMRQMQEFGFVITEEELAELNELLLKYGVEDKGSIALFLATCGHESAKGTTLLEEGNAAYWASQGYTEYTRGAGYMQVTGDDQEAFYKYINVTPPQNKTEDIAENYAWEASIWEWAMCPKGANVFLNDYVMQHGTSEEIFLITQYFVNGYIKGSRDFDDDLRSIRQGGQYEIDLDKNELRVNGHRYRLPNNYEDRRENYVDAVKVFLGN